MKPKRRADLYTRREAAEYLGVSTSWLGVHGKAGTGPRETWIGGRLYYRLSDLDGYIDDDSRGERPWESTSEQDLPSGNTDLSTGDGRFGGPLAKQTSDWLREKLAASKPKSSPPSLHLVVPSTE